MPKKSNRTSENIQQKKRESSQKSSNRKATKPLSLTQRRGLTFIEDYVSKNGYTPSAREIAAGLGYKSPSSANYIINQLTEKGYIERAANKDRNIKMSPNLGTPIYDVFGCSNISSAQVVGEFPWRMNMPSKYMSVICKEKSISAADIDETCILRLGSNARIGDYVLVDADGSIQMRKFTVNNGHIWFESDVDQDSFPPIDGSGAEIIGVLLYVIKNIYDV